MEPANNIHSVWVQNALKGDSKAQSHLYQQYSKAMFHICTRMTGNREQAEDVLQDAFVLAFKNLHQLKDAVQFGGWLRRIVVNECIRFSKKTIRWQEWEDHFEEIAMDDSTAWWKTVDLNMVHQQIKALPDGCREVFNLYAVEDLSHKEIASQLGCSESTSKSQYHRAKQLLRKRINAQMALHG